MFVTHYEEAVHACHLQRQEAGNAVGGPTCAQHACPDAYYYINALFWDSLARGEMQHQNKHPNERLDTSTLKGTTW